MPSIDREPVIRAAFDAGQMDTAARVALETYGDEIASFLHARLRSSSDAGEVFSMFAEDLWTGLASFEWRCSVRTWFYTLARNAASRYAASPHARAGRQLPLSQSDSVSAVVARLRTATNVYQRTTVKDRFKLLREQLDPEDQTLLILRVDRGLSFRDLAIAMSGDLSLDEEARTKEAARLRKAFERIKLLLREMAEREGLLSRNDE
jgi:RNA polymerase sigma-70 factor (ECF subfamily)